MWCLPCATTLSTTLGSLKHTKPNPRGRPVLRSKLRVCVNWWVGGWVGVEGSEVRICRKYDTGKVRQLHVFGMVSRLLPGHRSLPARSALSAAAQRSPLPRSAPARPPPARTKLAAPPFSPLQATNAVLGLT
jgi:hypothetical protein